MAASLRDVIAVLDQAYPPSLAAEWDSVGLACGDLDATVSSVLLAVDPVQSVLDEALLEGCDLIVTHHPLFLRGVHSVATSTSKGRLVHTAIGQGIAIFTAHTNADHARNGVSDALASALGVVDTVPLVPEPGDANVGTGRVGRLTSPMTLAAFADVVAAALPTVEQGVRVAGDPERVVRTVAVCGGSGDSFLGAAAGVADVYVTSDLRHHRAQDHLLDGGSSLIDVAHWAGEWPWLPVAAEVLRTGLAARGSTVDIRVSTIVTDPWTLHRGA